MAILNSESFNKDLVNKGATETYDSERINYLKKLTIDIVGGHDFYTKKGVTIDVQR